MATKKFEVVSPFLNRKPISGQLSRSDALAAAAARNLANKYAYSSNTSDRKYSSPLNDPYSYGYGGERMFFNPSTTQNYSEPVVNYVPSTVNNVTKYDANDAVQYLSGALKSLSPQSPEVAPNRTLNGNLFTGYQIRFGKGGAAKKAMAELQGILSKLPKGSAASQEKVARELEQEAADQAALYTAQPISNKTGKDAIAQAKQTLSAPKAKKPLTKEQFQNQYVQHIDLRGREGNAEENAKSIMESGFRRGVNANAYTPFSGLPHRDVVSAKFQPQEGDFVYLAPKGQWVTTPNGVKIKEGFKPEPHEVIRVTDPNMSMYEHYLANFGKANEVKQPLVLKVKPPSDNILNVRQSNFNHSRPIGNETVNIEELSGGVRMSDPSESKRVDELAAKISSPDGYISRIIVDQDNNVIEGQHRLEALRQLGVQDVPVYKIEDLEASMPVDKMRDAMNGVGKIHPDYVHQLLGHALDHISEGGIDEARKMNYGKFQPYYDAALNAIQSKAKGGVLHLAKGSQEFPLRKPAEVTEADMTPTEVNPLAGTASRLLAKGNQYVTKPFGYENPPMEFVTDLLGVPDWIKTLENKAYGTPNYSGSGQATRLNEEAVDPLLSLIPVVGYTAKVGKKLAKKAAPYAANQAVNLMEKYGVSPTMNVVKPKGGNWMDADKTVKAFKIRRPADHASPEKVLEDYDKYWNPSLLSTLTPEGLARRADARQNIVNQVKVNNWIDKKLGNYIKNELATPEDSIRLGMERRVEQAKKTKTDNDAKLAKMKESIDKRKAEGKDTTLSERDYEAAREKADEENLFANRSVSHLTAPEEGWALNLYKDDYYPNQASINKRIEAGYPEEGMSTNNQASKLWEDVSDYLVESRTANSIPDDSYMMKDNPWISKVAEKDPNTPIYSVNANDLNTELEFRHMVDELQEAMSPTSVLPQNLRISEKDLEKMTVDDVSALSGKITAWRAAQKVKSDKDIANNPAMHTFKEYTENNPKGVRWQQIKRPEGYSPEEQEKFVREATKYEGDIMRHCVGGAGHCEPLLNGEVEIYTLRDAKGEPHVTIEVDNGANAPTFYERNRELLEYPEIADEHQLINDTAENSAEYIRRVTRLLDESGYKEGEDYFIPKPKAPSIREIKGKGNQKPNDEYIPFVQDFIRSGQWDQIDDVQNTGMKYAQDALGLTTYRALKEKGINVPQLITSEDAMKFEEMLDPNYFNNPKFTRDEYIDNFNQTYAEGGLVEDDDNLMSLVDEHFLEEPQHFVLGGAARKLASKAAKSLEGQLDDSVEKLLDAHTAAKAKPKAKAKSNPDDKFLPLDLPRARRSKQEIQSEAERVSRQMMGEHVRDPRKPNDSANLADRSMAEVERLKGINYTLEDIKDLPEPIIIDPKLGDINIATVGDITVSDKRLVDMNGYPIDSVQQGGPFFGLGKLRQIADEDLWWASEHQAAKNFQARVDEIANHFGVDRLTAQHYAMGQRANNFAMHFADANLKAINTFGAPEEGIEGMNKLIREGYSLADKKTGERKYFAWPDFPGVENIDEAYVYFRKDPEARKWFNDRMKKPTVTDKFGLPNGLDIQYAISDEVLRNMEKNLTGRSVGEVYRGSGLKDTANHGTYDTGIKGRFLGRSKYPTPVKLSYSDAYDYTAARKRPSDVTGTLQKIAPHQIVDDQYLNEIGEFNYLINKYTGKRKGGRITAKDRVERKMYDLDANEPNRMGIAPYGLRYALTVSEVPQAKGKGYMGEMRGSEGVVTEYSLDDMELGAFPSVTPNQPNENLDEINRGKVSHSTYQLAKKYAAMRKKAGKSAFAQMDELRYPQPQD